MGRYKERVEDLINQVKYEYPGALAISITRSGLDLQEGIINILEDPNSSEKKREAALELAEKVKEQISEAAWSSPKK